MSKTSRGNRHMDTDLLKPGPADPALALPRDEIEEPAPPKEPGDVKGCHSTCAGCGDILRADPCPRCVPSYEGTRSPIL